MKIKNITTCFENNEQGSWVMERFGTFLSSLYVESQPDLQQEAVQIAKRAYWESISDCSITGEDSIGITPFFRKYKETAQCLGILLCQKAPYQGIIDSVKTAKAAIAA